jgi:hypothetical protein
MAALDKGLSRRVKQAIERFAATGAGDVRKLQGIEPPEFRLRVGDSRTEARFESSAFAITRKPTVTLGLGLTEAANALKIQGQTGESEIRSLSVICKRGVSKSELLDSGRPSRPPRPLFLTPQFVGLALRLLL